MLVRHVGLHVANVGELLQCRGSYLRPSLFDSYTATRLPRGAGLRNRHKVRRYASIVPPPRVLQSRTPERATAQLGMGEGTSPALLNAAITGLKFFFTITADQAGLMARMQLVRGQLRFFGEHAAQYACRSAALNPPPRIQTP